MGEIAFHSRILGPRNAREEIRAPVHPGGKAIPPQFTHFRRIDSVFRFAECQDYRKERPEAASGSFRNEVEALQRSLLVLQMGGNGSALAGQSNSVRSEAEIRQRSRPASFVRKRAAVG